VLTQILNTNLDINKDKRDFLFLKCEASLSVLDLEMVEAVAVVTMNNPPVNALGPGFLSDLEAVLRCLDIGLKRGFAKGMEAERAAFYDNIRSPDATEGIRAFLAGEQPRFTGNKLSGDRFTKEKDP
jgi:enoyl-CoA hydratase/carnithine racemase